MPNRPQAGNAYTDAEISQLYAANPEWGNAPPAGFGGTQEYWYPGSSTPRPQGYIAGTGPRQNNNGTIDPQTGQLWQPDNQLGMPPPPGGDRGIDPNLNMNPQSVGGGMPPPPGGTPPPPGGMPPPPGNQPGQYSPFQTQPAPTPPSNAMPTPPSGGANYGDVQSYSDQAYDESRRYLDPQQEQEQRRLQQDLINKGIDPNSAAGMRMMDDMSMRQGDQNSAAAFNSLQFGQGIQDQYTQQGLANKGINTQRYGMDLGDRFNMGQLDVARQGQDFNQMMGLEGVDFRNRAYNDNQMKYQDQLYMAMLAQNPIPAGSQVNPYDPYNQNVGGSGTNTTIGVGG